MPITFTKNSRRPILKLTLPAIASGADVVVTNLTTGKSLALLLPVGWPTTQITLDFQRRTVTDTGGADRSALIDPQNDSLWSLAPLSVGVNEIHVEVIPWGVASVAAFAGNGVDDASVGEKVWSSPANIRLSDNLYAQAELKPALPKISHALRSKSHGFVIPTNCREFVGITAEVEKKAVEAEEPVVTDFIAKVVKGGVINGAQRASAAKWSAADTVTTYGGESDMHGLTLGRSDVEDPEFGFAIAAQVTGAKGAGILSVDSIKVAVYYLVPQTGKAAAAYGGAVQFSWENGYY